SQALEAVSQSLQTFGHGHDATNLYALASRAKQLDQNELDSAGRMKLASELRTSLSDLMSRTNIAQSLVQSLSAISPFALHGERPGSQPFLVIEDSGIFASTPGQPGRIERGAWKQGSYTRGQRSPRRGDSGAEPLVIYTAPLGAA